MGGGFLMPACQWFADKIAQAVQKIAQTVQFFVDASSGLWNSLNMQTKTAQTNYSDLKLSTLILMSIDKKFQNDIDAIMDEISERISFENYEYFRNKAQISLLHRK